jgi:hypothetical protein
MLFKKKKDKQNEVEVSDESTLYGTRYYKYRNFDEESDFLYTVNEHYYKKIFKFTLYLVIASSILMTITSLYLFAREDTRFYLSSDNGVILEIDTDIKPVDGVEVMPLEEAIGEAQE